MLFNPQWLTENDYRNWLQSETRLFLGTLTLVLLVLGLSGSINIC